MPHIIEFAKDQFGSRLIQQKLETCTPDQKHKVYSQFKATGKEQDVKQQQSSTRDSSGGQEETSKDQQTTFKDLVKDQFANYVIQKLFEYGNFGQKKGLQEELGYQGAIDLSFHSYGCWVMQRQVEFLDGPGLKCQLELIHPLTRPEMVLSLVDDQNGNHVIQKVIEKMPNNEIQFVCDQFKGNMKRLQKHTYGCRVIQRLTEHCYVPQLKVLLQEIVDEDND